MRTWPTSPPRSGEQDEEEEDDKAPLSPTYSFSREYGGGGGIRSPLMHARTSWQKFVKRRGVSKKRSSTTSYDLKHVNSLERRSVSVGSRRTETFLICRIHTTWTCANFWLWMDPSIVCLFVCLFDCCVVVVFPRFAIFQPDRQDLFVSRRW